jgi:hypothetical protein
MSRRVRLLLTSVGGRAGQYILDVLEYPGFSRRSLVQVVATNSLPDAASNFRCDRCYLVPPTAGAEYPARMQEILRDESPDLILCGRDEDTYALSQLKQEHPDLPGALPVGPPQTALIGLDKFQTWLFARKHELPFAESFMPGQSGDGPALRENHTVFGDVMDFSRRVVDPTLDALVLDYAGALFLEGGTGPMNVQLRENRDGLWIALEINLRTNGLLNQFLMGVDQLGFIVNTFVPRASFPELRPHNADRCDQVQLRTYSYQIFASDISILRNSGVWSRS